MRYKFRYSSKKPPDTTFFVSRINLKPLNIILEVDLNEQISIKINCPFRKKKVPVRIFITTNTNQRRRWLEDTLSPVYEDKGDAEINENTEEDTF